MFGPGWPVLALLSLWKGSGRDHFRLCLWAGLIQRLLRSSYGDGSLLDRYLHSGELCSQKTLTCGGVSSHRSSPALHPAPQTFLSPVDSACPLASTMIIVCLWTSDVRHSLLFLATRLTHIYIACCK